MAWGGMRGFWPLLGIIMTVGPASAQVTPLDIFGGLLGAVQAQAAREAWARLPNGDRSCVDRAMARRNTDIAAMIQRGIGPDDGRLTGFFTECRRFTEPNLRRGFSGTTPDENNWSVTTTCNQSFAYRDGNGCKSEDFGVVVVPNTASVHYRVAPDKAEAHAAILTHLSDRIGDELSGQIVVTPTFADGAFTALATTSIKMRNRIRREYQDVCYVTGCANDAEFGLMRDPFGETCDEVGPKRASYTNRVSASRAGGSSSEQ